MCCNVTKSSAFIYTTAGMLTSNNSGMLNNLRSNMCCGSVAYHHWKTWWQPDQRNTQTKLNHTFNQYPQNKRNTTNLQITIDIEKKCTNQRKAHRSLVAAHSNTWIIQRKTIMYPNKTNDHIKTKTTSEKNIKTKNIICQKTKKKLSLTFAIATDDIGTYT